MCDKAAHLSNAEFLQPEKTQFYLNSVTRATATHGMMTRLIAFIGLETIKKIALENKPLKSLLGDQRTKGYFEGKFEAASLEAVLSLEDNFDRLSSEEKMLTSTVRPKFVTKTLKFITEPILQLALSMCGEHKIASSQWLPVAAVFLKLYLVVQFNHRIIDAFKANYNSVSLPRLVLGSGMFLASSLINHGCDATMYQVSYGTTAVFRARRPVGKGEQLTNCYIMPATNVRGKERRETLYNNYKFTCR
jgi:hypothetical protein